MISSIRKTHSKAIRADIIQNQGEFYTTLRVMQNKQWLHFWLTPEQERDLLSQLLGKETK